MTTYICKCGRRVKKSTDASTTGNRLSGYAPGHECWGCPYAMPYGNYQWDESARTVSRETQGYECRMSKTLTYASEFAGSIKDKCTCRVHSLDFDFLSQVSAWIKDTYPDREIFGSFSKDIRASDYGSDGRYCLTITCTQNLKGVAAKRELLGQFFTPNGSRKDMTPQQEMEKILADIRKCTQEPPATEAVAALPSAEAAAPGFDFGADAQTNALLLQDAQTFITGNMARIMAAKHAHDLTASHYKGSWGKWCAAVGISRDTGDNMVRVAEQFGNIEIEGKPILDVQPLKLLYAAAKPSTPQEIKEAVFSGDITTYKEYQDVMAQLKAEKKRADTAENQLDAARADVAGLHEQNTQLKENLDASNTREEEAWKSYDKAVQRAKTAEAERDKARADQLSTAKDCNRLGLKAEQEKARADKAEGERDEWKAEAEAARKQPIVAVVDKDEVARQVDALTAEAKAQARSQVEDAQRRANEAEAKYQKLQQDADGFLAPEQACEQQARFIADSMRSMYLNWFGQACATGTPLAQMGAPLYALCGEIISSLEDDTTINPTAAGSVEDAEREALFE